MRQNEDVRKGGETLTSSRSPRGEKEKNREERNPEHERVSVIWLPRLGQRCTFLRLGTGCGNLAAIPALTKEAHPTYCWKLAYTGS